MTFDEVIGQGNTKAQLRQMKLGGRLPHALLLLGPAGSGNLALALAFARYMLCEHPGPEDACGHCRHCGKVNKLIHPDLHFSFPTIGTNVTSDAFLPQWRSALAENPYLEVNDWLQMIGAENKQGNINKEECVQIIRKLSLKTFESPYKILIMWLPEYLGKEGNRLLKMIEEPPEHTVFLLVAENQELILNTIVSRCQVVRVNPLSDDEVAEGLLRLGLSDASSAGAVAQLCDGNFNEARTLAQRRENDHATFFLDWLRRCYKGNGVELVQWAEKCAALGRENQKHFLRYALHFYREFLVLKMTGREKIRLQQQELETARRMTAVIGFDQLEQLIRICDDCSYHVERNANPKILFLDASIRMHKILKRTIPATAH